ncbi:MAG: WD40 repeat domain-containing protein [Magnetococcales bacterium]|nr:WD40 repeat domain-containing protein [Magnetococcales bacterium]
MSRILMVAIFAVVLLQVTARVAEAAAAVAPTSKPLIRIEGGMHNAQINRLAVDRRNRILATASSDKTVRLWSVSDGALLKVLRVPLGQGAEGQLFAVALSPTGDLVAAGGWTGVTWDKSYSLYLFDVESGVIVRRFTGLPSTIKHLAFSADGRLIAVMLSSGKGIRIFRATTGERVSGNDDCQDDAVWGDFSADGRLVVSCYDGTVYLYGRDWHLSAKREFRQGVRPHGVAFSPEADKVAVGFADNPKVAVLSGQGLVPLYEADTSGVRGNLWSVVWSNDGRRRLFAAGTHASRGVARIRWWADEGVSDRSGESEVGEWVAPGGTITGILPLGDGSLVFASTGPSLGRLDAQGFTAFLKESPSANFAGLHGRLLASQDGTSVQFGFGGGGTLPAVFSVRDLRLSNAPDSTGNLKGPVESSPGVTIDGWDGGNELTLNGRGLPLESGETTRCLAIDPKGRYFVVGTSLNLRVYTLAGSLRTRLPIVAEAQGVTVSGDGRIIVMALANGTIHWYRVASGRRLLSLFPHRDRQRWVVWTPAYFYAASRDGDKLIGWHRNQSASREALFYPIGRHGSGYNRPDLIRKLF